MKVVPALQQSPTTEGLYVLHFHRKAVFCPKLRTMCIIMQRVRKTEQQTGELACYL